MVVLVVLAYQTAGPLGVAVLGVLRTIPTVVAVPLAGAAFAHVHGRRLLLATYLARAVAIVAVIVGVTTGQAALVVGAAAVDSVLGTLRRPVQATLLPMIARTPDDLVAANVATTTGEGLAGIIGPIIGSIVLVTAGVEWVLVVSALGFLVAAGLIARVSQAGSLTQPEAGRSVRHSLTGGMTALWHGPIPRVVTIGFLAQALAQGALNVLLVPAAVVVYGMGQAGVGSLYAAIGVGGLVGATISFLAIGPDRLTSTFVAGLLTWGGPLIVLGVVAGPAPAALLLAVVGIGNAVVDVAGYSLLQRSLGNGVRASGLATVEGIIEAATGLGGLLGPLLIFAFGVQGSFVACGVALVVSGLAVAPRLAAHRAVLDARTATVVLLRRASRLSPLPLAVVEELAALSESRAFAPGAVVIREGDIGDRFYVVVGGSADVTIEGRHVATCDAGDGFGEIALLHRVPRTATVRAARDLRTLSIDGPAFVRAVTGEPG